MYKRQVGSSASGLVRTVARDLRSSELTGIFSSFQLLAQNLAELLGLSQILCIGTTSGDFMSEGMLCQAGSASADNKAIFPEIVSQLQDSIVIVTVAVYTYHSGRRCV